MKLHKNLTQAVEEGILQIEQGGYADKVVEKLLKKDKRWGARDRAFIAETIYEIVRYKRLYLEILGLKEINSAENAQKILFVWCVLNKISLPEWFLKGISSEKIKKEYEKLSKVRKFRESIPDWLDILCEKELSKEIWEREIEALNKQASVVLRVNRLKTSTENLKETLLKENILVRNLEDFPDALILEKRSNVFGTQAFKQGFFEVQDASSQIIAPLLEVKKGHCVADCCAGAGGKTLHLASLMQNKGQIIAMDIFDYKLEELKRRARRNGAFNIETKIIDNKQVKKYFESFDRILIDAPCSGLGVLKRNPDTKWKLRPEFISEITKTQQEILQNYSKMLKKGGKLLYATCSILPSENQKQVEIFLNSQVGKDFSLVKQEQIFPSKGFDGFFYALFDKKGSQ